MKLQRVDTTNSEHAHFVKFHDNTVIGAYRSKKTKFPVVVHVLCRDSGPVDIVVKFHGYQRSLAMEFIAQDLDCRELPLDLVLGSELDFQHLVDELGGDNIEGIYADDLCGVFASTTFHTPEGLRNKNNFVPLLKTDRIAVFRNLHVPHCYAVMVDDEHRYITDFDFPGTVTCAPLSAVRTSVRNCMLRYHPDLVEESALL